MAFTRDLGIQFPADATQAAPGSSLTARRAYRYLVRGSRYGGQLGKLSGFEYPLGITFFRNLMPKSKVDVPEPIEYARFIDVRKTKLVDGIKELIFGTMYRGSLTHQLDVEKKPGQQRDVSWSRRVFPAKLTGVAFINQAYLHEWYEVEWDNGTVQWTIKEGGFSSEGSLAKRAIHGPSDGQLGISTAEYVLMDIRLEANGAWRAIFSNGNQGFWVGKITGLSEIGSNTPLYDARALPVEQYPDITVTETAPINRLIMDAKYQPSNVNDPCLFIRETFADPIRLIILTEVIETVVCPNPIMFSNPIGSPKGINSVVSFVNNSPNAIGAIGQAI